MCGIVIVGTVSVSFQTGTKLIRENRIFGARITKNIGTKKEIQSVLDVVKSRVRVIRDYLGKGTLKQISTGSSWDSI